MGPCGYGRTWDASLGLGGAVKSDGMLRLQVSRYDMVLEILLSELFSAAAQLQRRSWGRGDWLLGVCNSAPLQRRVRPGEFNSRVAFPGSTSWAT